ncbi:class I SAM-dependent methyltransferase [Actinoplanes sp. NPDC051861]|uniref:class I SAM-dependent methyltransferase n=1 Tax=Actinoplanes sp. NPDC051861 TaxID=3155170 RepID=UPI00343F2395
MLEHHGSGVYLWRADSFPPSALEHDGVVLERFMDRIFVPIPFDELTPVQISTINTIRERVLGSVPNRTVNEQVKRAVAGFLARTSAKSALEWGCGYAPIGQYLPEVAVDYLDIDPAVVSFHRAARRRCYFADNDNSRIPASRYDAIISVFVWHFHVSFGQMRSMLRGAAAEWIRDSQRLSA